MRFVSPYLYFSGDTEEAFAFYQSVFAREMTGIVRFRDMGESGMELSEADLDKVAHVSLPLVQDVSLMGSDLVGPSVSSFNPGNNIYLYVECESGEEADRLFMALSDGAQVMMPVQSTGWAEKYSICVDRFGRSVDDRLHRVRAVQSVDPDVQAAPAVPFRGGGGRSSSAGIRLRRGCRAG